VGGISAGTKEDTDRGADSTGVSIRRDEQRGRGCEGVVVNDRILHARKREENESFFIFLS
jgi:hypothetical protein